MNVNDDINRLKEKNHDNFNKYKKAFNNQCKFMVRMLNN